MPEASSKISFPAKNEPAYILQAVDRVGFFGAHSLFRVWCMIGNGFCEFMDYTICFLSSSWLKHSEVFPQLTIILSPIKDIIPRIDAPSN